MIDGILSTLDTLSDLDKAALESRFRFDKTFTQVGHDLGGLSPSKASKAVSNALVKLRHPSNLREMSKVRADKHDDTLRANLEEARHTIDNLCDVLLSKGLTAEKKLLAALEVLNIRLSALDLSPQTVNCMYAGGKGDIRSVLEIRTYAELRSILGIGRISGNEIIAKMRNMGFTDWASRMHDGRP